MRYAETNLRCLNIGLHHINQLNSIDPAIEMYLPVRWMMQDILKEEFLSKYPDRINESNSKTWKLNDCNMPNEKWILLEGDIV